MFLKTFHEKSGVVNSQFTSQAYVQNHLILYLSLVTFISLFKLFSNIVLLYLFFNIKNNRKNLYIFYLPSLISRYKKGIKSSLKVNYYQLLKLQIIIESYTLLTNDRNSSELLNFENQIVFDQLQPKIQTVVQAHTKRKCAAGSGDFFL